MESVLTTRKGVCYLCHAYKPTDLHHIIHAGTSKKVQERMGLVVYLCRDCHSALHDNGTDKETGINQDMDLKRLAQRKWEQKYIEDYPYEHHAKEAAREEWMKNIRRNYL